MLKKIYRINVGQRYAFVDSFNTPYFLVKIAKNNLLYNRYGFVVSKRVDKRAVVRNSIKRQMQACLQNNSKKVKPGYDMLFIARRAVTCNALFDALQNKGYVQ
ncbi:MAG: ribonuclease P protein component [Candidatus Levybacteria bacterium]|nr:ribonuclease P protein component [Candidatus Levybacteria bacterium]